jgi:predicted nucleic acid-binding Zn ribbon protein
MNCKYCGHGLPSRGGKCPGCGKMIPMDQQRQMKEMLDPRWNQFRSQDTAFYKSEANNDSKSGKKNTGLLVVILIVVILLLIIVLKGAGN